MSLARFVLRSSRLRIPRTRPFSTAPPPNPPGKSHTLRNAALALGLGISTYTLGSLYPPQTLQLLFPPLAAPPPTDPNSAEYKRAWDDLENQLQSLPLLTSLRSAPDADDWYETRPYRHFPEERRVNNLTAGALRGPGRLGVIPLVRSRKDEKESVIIIHVGRGLCGHDGIVHGGLLAAVLDETLGRTAIINLPDQVGVTANLEINYRAPTKADQFIVIKTHLTKLEGRKAWVEGAVEDLEGKVLVEAKTMFIQPKYAKLLNTKTIRQILGEPESIPHPPPSAKAGEHGKEPIHLGEGVERKGVGKTQ